MLLFLAGCFSGAVCTANSQCGGTEQCVPGGAGYGCGEYSVDYPCGDSGGCDTASVCIGFVEGCGEGTTCVPRCADDDGCASTEQCDEATHTCVTRPCTDPVMACAVLTHCDEATGGCVPDTCILRSDCVDGFCVNGTCSSEPGQCSGARP